MPAGVAALPPSPARQFGSDKLRVQTNAPASSAEHNRPNQPNPRTNKFSSRCLPAPAGSWQHLILGVGCASAQLKVPERRTDLDNNMEARQHLAEAPPVRAHYLQAVLELLYLWSIAGAGSGGGWKTEEARGRGARRQNGVGADLLRPWGMAGVGCKRGWG